MYNNCAPSISTNSRRFRLGRLGLLLFVAFPLLAQSADTVTVNGRRSFNITPQTTFSLDGDPISLQQATALGAGYNAQVSIDNVNAATSAGDATNVDLRNLARGPVTATDPLSVLQQPLVATSETVLVDIPGNDLANIVVGDLLEVSGVLDVNGAMAATRIQFLANPTIDWKLFGQVSALNDPLFSIGAQAIDASGVTPMDCPTGLQNGEFVEIEALADPDYAAGSVLGQLTQIECEDPDFDDPPPGTINASLEGIISDIPDPLPTPATFSMLGIEVVTTAQTEYRRGSIDDLDVGVRVEVEGIFDDIASTITAHEVRFVQTQVRFEAPVEPADVIPGESILIMGSTAGFTAQTRDEDGIVNGLAASSQVEVRGMMDSEGLIFATRVRERGQPDLADTELRGPVAEINQPELQVLGITVDTSAAQFRDHDQNPISAEEFFARLFPGTLISAEDAIYDPVGGRMIAGTMELEENTVPAQPAQASGVSANGVSRGTLTQLGADVIFRHGFDGK